MLAASFHVSTLIRLLCGEGWEGCFSRHLHLFNIRSCHLVIFIVFYVS
jgi:hypothetical protein